MIGSAAVWAALMTGLAANAAPTTPLPTVAQYTASLQRRTGLLDHWVQPRTGQVWLAVAPPVDGVVGEFLLAEGLVSGLGSNDIGLDRGQLGETYLLRLRRVGPKVLFELPNLGYRADVADPEQQRAVSESFATSVIWAEPLVAEDPTGAGVIELTRFVTRDAHGVIRALARAGQGSYSRDDDRSVVVLEACLGFPDNLVFEAVISFTCDEPGAEVARVAPLASDLTVRQRQMLIRLPQPGFRPRAFDSRSGSFAIEYQDHGAGLDRELIRRWIVRHRIQVRESDGRRSVLAPIVYYVDRAMPADVRDAVVAGASWWAAAFAAAGLGDGFRVELLPQGAHPLDVRYNVIQWVHRSSRGWSYGGGIVDPRTGERLKGHVNLGSLRVRHDRLLFEGLLGTAATGTGRPDDPILLALRRIRQLAAHEVGHALGLAHNFAASSFGRASVMDYPPPRVLLAQGGQLDASEAYAEGIGVWDVHAIGYAYGDFGIGAAEARGLQEWIRRGSQQGYLFLTDADARAAASAHPLASLWDDGPDPVASLGRTLEVRARALANFGRDRILAGTPLALLEERLTPVYFHHRYQVQAAAKLVGGVSYQYFDRDEAGAAATAVAADEQRRALAMLLRAIAPEALDLADPVLDLLVPRAFGHDRHRDLLQGRSEPAFDPLAAAAAAAGLVVDALLEPERCARLVEQHRRSGQLPGLDEVLTRLIDTAFVAQPAAQGESPRRREIAWEVQGVLVDRLLDLGASKRTGPGVGMRVDGALRALRQRLTTAKPVADPMAAALWVQQIDRHYDGTGGAVEHSRRVAMPPGSPIGGGWAAGCSVGEP